MCPWLQDRLIDASDYEAESRLARAFYMVYDAAYQRVQCPEESRFKLTAFAYLMGAGVFANALVDVVAIAERFERPLSWKKFLVAYGKRYGRVRGMKKKSWRPIADRVDGLWQEYQAMKLSKG